MNYSFLSNLQMIIQCKTLALLLFWHCYCWVQPNTNDINSWMYLLTFQLLFILERIWAEYYPIQMIIQCKTLALLLFWHCHCWVQPNTNDINSWMYLLTFQLLFILERIWAEYYPIQMIIQCKTLALLLFWHCHCWVQPNTNDINSWMYC